MKRPEKTDEEHTYTAEEIADLLGVSASSILRWVDSGKLRCINTVEGDRKFSVEHLKEFAVTYNISMNFLMEPVQREIGTNDFFPTHFAVQ